LERIDSETVSQSGRRASATIHDRSPGCRARRDGLLFGTTVHRDGDRRPTAYDDPGGVLDHDETVKGMAILSREVSLRLKDLR
jgi:hypothetical protein